MSLGDYLGGLLVLAGTLGGVLAGTVIIARRRLPCLEGSTRVLAGGVVATAGLLAVHLIPGMLGVLSRGSVLAATGLWVLLALAVPATDGPPAAPPEARAEEGTARATATAGLLAVAVFTVATAISQLGVASGAIDLLNFHLPGVARWIQGGSIWHVSELLPDVAPGAYPGNGDVVLLAAVLPWHNDFLAHYAMYPFYAMTGLAVYGLGRELAASRALATLAACMVVAIPAVAIPALVSGLVDAVMLFGFASGIVFLLRHARTGAPADLVLAGVALGISFGTKWYAVWAVGIVFVIWAVASAATRPARAVARQGAWLVGLVALAGGVWLLRNWIADGNPFFPVRVAPLGITVFGAPHDVVREQAGFSIADYLGYWGPWGDLIVPQLRHVLAAPGALIGLGTVCTVPIALAGRGVAGARRVRLAACLAAALALAVAYAVTPYTAGGPHGFPVLTGADARYLVPALAVGAAAVAAAVSGAGRGWWIAAALLALVAIADGLRWSAGAGGSAAGVGALDWLLALGIVGASAGLALAARGRVRRSRWQPVALAAVLGAVVLAAAGFVDQRHYNDHRYLGVEPAVDWLSSHAPSGRRIGVTGVWDDGGLSPVLPAFGPRLGNDVAYVGREDRGFLRRYRDRASFAAALRRGGYDLLIVGLGRPPAIPRVPEARWARESGFETIARSDRLALLLAPGAKP